MKGLMENKMVIENMFMVIVWFSVLYSRFDW